MIAPSRHGWEQEAGWPGQLYQRLLDQRIVMAHGHLDGEAATRVCAQLLTLDAEGTEPIRLEIQNLEAELPAALEVMGVLDTLRVSVTAHVGGRTNGPALGVLVAARHRLAYPNAIFVLSEPSAGFEGTAGELVTHERALQVMLGELYQRLAEVTGREVDELRADARRHRLLTVTDAVAYGLIEGRVGHSGADEPSSPGEGPRGRE